MTTPFNVMSQLNNLVEKELAVQTVDMTETGTGGYENVLLEAGTYSVRFMEYIEQGKKTPMYEGKPTGRPAVLNVKIGFLIYGPDGVVVRNRSLPMAIGNSEKARFKKLFDRLNKNKDIQHAAQKLGQAYRMEITVDKNKSGKEYNGMVYESLTPLPKFDPETGEPMKVPELVESDLKLFLWANPTKETWDSLYIDGKNDKGESKNFIQNDILGAVDYAGSPLQALLEGGLPTPSDLAPAPAAETAPAAPTTPAAPAAPVTPAAPAAPAAPTAPAAPAA